MPYGFRVIKTEGLLKFLVSSSFSHGPHLSVNIVNTVHLTQGNTETGPEMVSTKYKFTFTQETSVGSISLFICGGCELS